MIHSKWFCLTALVVTTSALSADAQPGQRPMNRRSVPEGVRVVRDIEYSNADGNRLALDLYLPEKTDGKLPVIVAIHGGGWAAGQKEGAPGVRLSGRGYAVAAISYRLSGKAIFPAQIIDCKSAVRWLRANAAKYNLDPDRIGATGHSAGGHLASMLGTTGDVKEFDRGENLEFSSRIQAACPTAGPSDLLQMDAQALPGSRLKHNDPQSPESRLIGGSIQDNKEKSARANPITYVTKDDPPFLILHGDSDPVVPPQQAQILSDALSSASVSAELHFIKGGGHGFGGPEVDRWIDDFFDRHLKLESARNATSVNK